jgi:ribonuclease HII
MPRKADSTPRSAKTTSLSHEQALWAQGYAHIVGIDEVGRGAWAGPVVAAAVCLPTTLEVSKRLKGVRDSKQMTARQRDKLIAAIEFVALGYGRGQASVDEITTHGIRRATVLAMERALAACRAMLQDQHGGAEDYVLCDSIKWEAMQGNAHFAALVRGDQQSLTISAASVLAKTHRDQLMSDYAAQPAYAAYHFDAHKGYGTAQHRTALTQHGISDQHRSTFKPIRELATGTA